MIETRTLNAVDHIRVIQQEKAKRPMLAKLLCVINRHRPARGEVHWEGTCYIASCKRCTKKIVRRKGTSWRKL